MRTYLIIASFFILIISRFVYGQDKTNVDIIHGLIDKSVNEIAEDLAVEDVVYFFGYSSLPEYNILQNRAVSAISKILPITTEQSKSTKTIKYNLDKAGVNYNKTFKNGFLGTYKVERQFLLKGNYLISYNDQITESNDFEFTLSDTVDYDKLKELESISLQFARSELPPEPLLPSLLEPAIAIAAIAVTVVLFFTVRSN